MDSYAVILRGQRGRVAEGVIEANDLDTLSRIVEGLVLDVADCMERGTVLDPVALVEAEGDETLVARVLRSILFEGIEAFRRELDPPAFNEAVLALRACVHPVIFRPKVDPEERAFFDQLLGGSCSDDDSVRARVIKLFHDLSVTSRDIVYVHDLNGTMLYVNKPGLELTKLTTEELLGGISIYDFVTPEFLEIIESRMEAPGTVSRAPYCSEIYTKDGDRIPMEITTCTLMRDRQLVGVMGVARDLRLARRLENEIRRTHMQLDSLLAHVPAGVVLTDGVGIVLDVNRAALSLIGAPSEGALIGGPLFRLCGDDGGCLHQAHAKALSTGEKAVVRYSQASAFGARMNCEIFIVPLALEGSCVNAAMVIITDLPREGGIQDRAAQMEEYGIVGKAVGGLAHELNNPLTGIIGYVQLLLSSVKDPQARSRLENVMSEAERCRQIVQNLLRFAARHNAGVSMQDLNELLTDTLVLMHHRLHMEQIDTELRLEPDLPAVRIDPYDLQRGLLHILTNAQQALSSVEGHVRTLTVSTKKLGDRIEIRIGDNGPGIPDDIRPRVFERFFTTKTAEKAAGLGLSVAAEIIRRMGGEVKVVSGEGEGAVFSIVLPVGEVTEAEIVRQVK